MFISQELLRLQNRDGGWGYRQGSSWTEPTCFALLALAAVGMGASEQARRGSWWLAQRQRPDGGWPPRDGVAESTWVAALVLLLGDSYLGEGLLPEPAIQRAANWLMTQTGRESGWIYRLRMVLLGVDLPYQRVDGWPWYPGAAAWVAPTALTVLALQKFNRRRPDAQVQGRVEQGRRFLLARRCRDGGWNHGSTKALGYDSDSYPETTGLALLALHPEQEPEMAGAESLAERHLATTKSCQAASWLSLALLARGRHPQSPSLEARGGTIEIALAGLEQAAQAGRNWFLP